MRRLKRTCCWIGIFVLSAVLLGSLWAKGRGGGGGGRGGGGGARAGGGGARAGGGGGGGARLPSGGGGGKVGGGGHSPGFSAPKIQAPKAGGGGTPKIGGGGGAKIGGGGAANLKPGNITLPSPKQPGLDIGKRPGIDGGIGKKIDGGIGKKIDGGIGKKIDGGIGKRPDVGRPGQGVLPGLGLGIAGGALAGDVIGRRQDTVGNRQENLQNRSQNLDDRMSQREDFRNQTQEQRQEYMNNRREDWQNWHDDYYHHHDGWYHGGWHGHYGEERWEHLWEDHTAAMIFGTTMWGVNRMGYWFGTGSYSNPYYEPSPAVADYSYLDYSQPLAAPPEAPATAPPATVESASLPPGVTQEGMDSFENARNLFYEERYKEALGAVNKALSSMPKDAVMHEFRALVLYALGNYKDAATALHPVLAVGPGFDWTTMSGLYANTATYANQLRKLEDFVEANPKSAEGHFLLGYHYLTGNNPDPAATEFQHVHKLLPQDTVSAQLLTSLGKGPQTPAKTPAKSEAKIDAEKLVGAWTASGAKNSTFELTMSKDKSFTWTFRQGKSKQEVKGAYALDDATLALEPDAGGVMVADITDPSGGAFTFRQEGGPANDPGLKFKRK